jgi:predicted RND superfamily exporter protein
MIKEPKMTLYVNVLYRFRWFIAIVVPMLVIAFASYLKDLTIDGSYRIWFEEGSETLQTYDKFRGNFSNDDGITIVFRDENGMFNKKALQSIADLTEKLWDMPHVDRVDSLTNHQYVRVSEENPDEIRVENFIEEVSSLTPHQLVQLQKDALSDTLMEGSLISKDATTTMLFARLEPDANENGDISMELMKAVRAIVEPEAAKIGYKYWLNGGAPMTEAFVKIAEEDLVTFAPVVGLLSFLTLWMLFRRFSGAVLPLVVVFLTFLMVLASQTLMGYKLNNFTANIPVFIMAIGIADAIHLYSIWLMQRREGSSNYDAVYHSLQKNIMPVFLTSVTTTVGFSTLAISNIVPVSTLGIATGSGAILAFIISIVWMPAILFLLKKPHRVQKKQSQLTPTSQVSHGYGAFILKYNKTIVVTVTLLSLLIGAGLSNIRVDSNTIKFFSEKVEIRQSSEFTMQHLTGPMAYTLLVDSGQKNGIKEPVFLKTLERFQKEYEEKFTDVRKVYSLLDTVKRYNKIYNQKEEVPTNRDLIAQYLLLYSMDLPQGKEITDRVDFHEQVLRVTALTNIVETSKDLEMIDYAKAWWANTPYKVTMTGQTVMYAYMTQDITNTLIYSLTLTLIVVSLLMLLIFKRVKILWILMLPNILPVLLVLGIMGWLGITIDMGIAIAGAIIIGVAVDDTIHFLVKYFDAKRRGLPQVEVFNEVLHYAGRAIVFTTIVLSLSFGIFVFSDFTPNQNFGIVTATALSLAMVIDLLYLPALLSLFDTTKQTTLKEKSCIKN